MEVSIRPIRIDGNIAYVPLTKGYEAIIDAEDAVSVGQWNWAAYARHGRRCVYAIRSDRTGGGNKTIFLHRFLLECSNGFCVDHIDGNGLNNTRINLRIATFSQNQHNSTISRDNTSGYKGVIFDRRRNVWRAAIAKNRKRLHLGSFTTPEAAYSAYCDAAQELHGEFANPVCLSDLAKRGEDA
jgi:hypothetical protein